MKIYYKGEECIMIIGIFLELCVCYVFYKFSVWIICINIVDKNV